MAIDPKLPIPVYFQLKTLLLEEILEGRYGPDGRLPTEHQLCERHGISRTPVTRALSELATEGVVIRHRRRGTFVNPHWLGGHRGGPELRVVVPEGPWEGLIRRAAPADTRLSGHGGAARAPPGPDARGRRGARSRPGRPRLGLGARVHRRRVPGPAGGAGRGLGQRGVRARLPDAADADRPQPGAHLRGPFRGRRGRHVVPAGRPGGPGAGPAGHLGRAAGRRPGSGRGRRARQPPGGAARRLAEAGTEETVLRATLDLAAIEREREREPALRLRQPDLYRHGRR